MYDAPTFTYDVPYYKFTGKERDSESGLDNFGARYDSSSLGRFMTPDPLGGEKIDPQTLNKYSYVRNNPINLTDPTARSPASFDGKMVRLRATVVSGFEAFDVRDPSDEKCGVIWLTYPGGGPVVSTSFGPRYTKSPAPASETQEQPTTEAVSKVARRRNVSAQAMESGA